MQTSITQRGRIALARLVRGAWWLAWVPLFILAALYVGFHIPGALLILALHDDCAASRWLHDSTDWALDGIWKICPANAESIRHHHNHEKQ